MTRAQRLCRLEAQHQRALDALVDAMERDPVVERYMGFQERGRENLR